MVVDILYKIIVKLAIIVLRAVVLQKPLYVYS